VDKKQIAHLRRLLKKGRKSYIAAQRDEEKVFEYLEEVYGAVDWGNVESPDCNIGDSNIQGGITCYLNYGDGDLEVIINEIVKSQNEGGGENA